MENKKQDIKKVLILNTWGILLYQIIIKITHRFFYQNYMESLYTHKGYWDFGYLYVQLGNWLSLLILPILILACTLSLILLYLKIVKNNNIKYKSGIIFLILDYLCIILSFINLNITINIGVLTIIVGLLGLGLVLFEVKLIKKYNKFYIFHNNEIIENSVKRNQEIHKELIFTKWCLFIIQILSSILLFIFMPLHSSFYLSLWSIFRFISIVFLLIPVVSYFIGIVIETICLSHIRETKNISYIFHFIFEFGLIIFAITSTNIWFEIGFLIIALVSILFGIKHTKLIEDYKNEIKNQIE